MGDHEAISDVGETLVALLRDRMTDLVDVDQIALASPVDDDLKNKVRLTVFLYAIEGSSHHGPADRSMETHDPPRREPLRVDLRYLVTAHPTTGDGGTTTTGKTLEEQRVLGRAMQVLQDNAIVSGSDLRGSLAAGNERLQLSVLPETTDTVVNVWNTFQNEPFRPSVAYLVTPVAIESRREAPVERVEEFQVEEHLPTGGPDE